jgi:nicotinate-nucleotide adenylyltransferase
MSSKIGVFGGTFSPIHFGHINSILNVKEKMKLDEVKVIPAFQAPGKDMIESPTAVERLDIVNIALNDYLGEISVEANEIERGGVSYSVETLEELKKENPNDILYLIVGLDQFQKFDSWKDFERILELAHVVVTSRPGYFFPLDKTEFPKAISQHVADFDGYTAILNSGSQIFFVRLEDHDMSSSDIRKRVRLRQSINKFVPIEVEQYISKNKLYSMEEGVDYNSKDLTTKIMEILNQEQAINVLGYDLSEQNQITDFCIISSAQSKKANSSLVSKVIDQIRDELGVKPIAVDGLEDSNWIVIDYGSVMVHSFYEFVRYEYKLEELWAEYPKF